jgi:ABC-type dipeptide/oligopeptide/nickel transport system permease subunit
MLQRRAINRSNRSRWYHIPWWRTPQRMVTVGLFMVLAWPTLAVGAWLIPGLDPYQPEVQHADLAPSFHHPMGTDELGRDMLSRVLAGTLPSLGSALVIVVVASTVGTLVGVVAGYADGVIDLVLMRLADVFLALPGIIVALVIATVLNAGLVGAAAAISMTLWSSYARLTHDQVRVIKQEPFVLAACAMGASPLHLIRVHLLPHMVDLLAVQASLDGAVAVGMVAGFSYIGIGAAIPTPEWGMLIQEGYHRGAMQSWWVVAFPTLALVTVCGGLMLISDGIRDWRDVRRSWYIAGLNRSRG